METLEAIFTRRSIRKYINKPISKDIVDTLLKAGMQAPSSSNHQPWEFVVIEDKNIMIRITEIHSYSQMLKEASLAILVCGNSENKCWQQDCSAATQNILLATHSLGLGAVWIGCFPDIINPISSIFKLPEYIKALCVIAIGHPNEIKDKEDKFNIKKVHYNTW